MLLLNDMKIRNFIWIAAMMAVAGCGRKGESVEMGPAETVEAFFRELTSGDIGAAASLCDTLTMKDYISAYSEALNMQRDRDSSVAAIAAGMLKKAEIIIEDISKEGDRRVVTCTIDAGEGMKKRKTAVLKKEEGEWKVEKMTDRP